MRDHYDAIVIGVGGMGSAALYDLARRGKRVLGLERYAVPHDRGSSHGATRIIRLPYYENEQYVPLLREAYGLWHALETQTGSKLLHHIGSIDVGPESGGGMKNLFRNSLQSCLDHDISHEVLSAQELNQRFPGYKMPDGFKAVYQRDGGFLACESCISEHVNAAFELGARVHAHEVVQNDWDPFGEPIRIRTDRNEYTTDRLVVTAGPWAEEQLKTWLGEKHFTPQRQVLGWFQPERPADFSTRRFPVFNLQAEDDFETRYYGFPVWGVPGFKIGKYFHRKQDAQPGEPEVYEIERDEDEKVLRDGARRYFNGADGPLLGLRTCMFTNTLSEHPVIDRLPGCSNVVFAAGFTGHGFKFCSVVGRILGALVVGDDDCSAVEYSKFLRIPGAFAKVASLSQRTQ